VNENRSYSLQFTLTNPVTGARWHALTGAQAAVIKAMFPVGTLRLTVRQVRVK